MRIVFIISKLSLGGAQRQLIELANYIQAIQAVSVYIVSLNCSIDSVSILNRYNLNWSVIPCEISHSPYVFITKSLGRLFRFLIQLRKLKPDVIYSFMEQPNLVGALTFRLSGAKLFIWGQRNSGNLLRGSKLERFAARLTPLFISNSTMGQVALAKMLGVPTHKNFVVANGVTIDSPQHDAIYWRNKFGLEVNDFVVVMLANVTHHKDHTTLLKAWAYFKAHTPTQKSKLLLVGRKGNTTEKVIQLMNELNLSDSVILADFIEDVSGVLAICSVCLFTQKPGIEGLPNGVLECMAAGLPVIGSDIESLQCIVADENKRYLVEPGNGAAHGEALLTIFNNEPERKMLGELNRRKIEQEFSVEKMGEATWQLIKSRLV